MKILYWNSQELGNPHGIRALRDFIQCKDPNVMFLQETKLKARKMEATKTKQGFTCCLSVDCEGKGGGLALLWNCTTKLTVKHFSRDKGKQSIMVFYRFAWTFSGCRLMWYLGNFENALTWGWCRWFMGGGFNELLNNVEKQGGNPWPKRPMQNFKTTLDDCRLPDLGYTSNWFTWWNRQEEDENICERLNRFVTNKEWQSQF